MNAQGLVAIILATSIGLTLLSLTIGRYILAPEATSIDGLEVLSDFFKVTLSATIGSLATFLGTKPDALPPKEENDDETDH